MQKTCYKILAIKSFNFFRDIKPNIFSTNQKIKQKMSNLLNQLNFFERLLKPSQISLQQFYFFVFLILNNLNDIRGGTFVELNSLHRNFLKIPLWSIPSLFLLLFPLPTVFCPLLKFLTKMFSLRFLA